MSLIYHVSFPISTTLEASLESLRDPTVPFKQKILSLALFSHLLYSFHSSTFPSLILYSLYFHSLNMNSLNPVPIRSGSLMAGRREYIV